MTKDSILDDIVAARRAGHFGLPPSRVGRSTAEELLAETEHMETAERRLWLKENSNMRGPRVRRGGPSE